MIQFVSHFKASLPWFWINRFVFFFGGSCLQYVCQLLWRLIKKIKSVHENLFSFWRKTIAETVVMLQKVFKEEPSCKTSVLVVFTLQTWWNVIWRLNTICLTFNNPKWKVCFPIKWRLLSDQWGYIWSDLFVSYFWVQPHFLSHWQSEALLFRNQIF